jgi:dihydropyrimidine dehydrogenase (NAD+) subunit PreT
VKVDDALQTSRPGVWAAGDCIFEKGMREAMVVEVAQQGKLVAASIDSHLRSGVAVEA